MSSLRRMMAAVHDAILSVDLVVLLRDAFVSTGNGDRFVLDLVKKSGKPAILVLNKVDKLKEKNKPVYYFLKYFLIFGIVFLVFFL